MHGTWSQGRKLRVGLLALSSAGLLAGLLTMAIGVRIHNEDVTYHLLFEENVKGLVGGSRVNFQGVPVGAVRDIRFEAGATRVDIAVDPRRAAIQDITRGRLDRALVTGQVTVELEGWHKDGRELSSGGRIQTGRSPLIELTETLPDVASEAVDLVREAKQLFSGLNRLLCDDNQQRVASILVRVDEAARTLPQRLDATLADAQDVLAESRATAAALRQAADALRDLAADKSIKDTLHAARRAAERLEALEASASGLVRELHDVAAAARSPWLRALASANDTLLELRALARRLQLAPSSVLFGSRVEEITVPAAPPGEDK